MAERTMTEDEADKHGPPEPEDEGESREVGGAPTISAGPRPAGVSPFRPYKPGQGIHVRWGTAAGAGIIAVAGAMFAREWLRVPFGDSLILQTMIPVALLVAAAYLIFWLVGKRHGTVDFMIATEGEMKKVNWASRKEVFGATRVVIFTVIALGFLLFIVDLAFILTFAGLKVLKIPVWEQWFAGAGPSS